MGMGDPVTFPGCLGDHTGLGAQTLVLKKNLSSLFSVVLEQRYVEVAINNFTIHLIILKWFRRQKCRHKRKN